MILNWQNKVIPDGLVHIHGNRDRLLIPTTIKSNYWVKGGGHFMVWNMAEEVSDIINRNLQTS